MLRKSMSDDGAISVPDAHAGVIVAHLAQRKRQVPVRRLPNVVQFPGLPVGVEHFAKDSRRSCRGKEAGGARTGRARTAFHSCMRFDRLIAHLGEPLARHDVQRFPLGQLLGKPRLNFGAVVVLGTRRPVAPDPFVFASLSGFQGLYDAFLVDDGVELLAHVAGLGLGLDLIAVDHAPAIGIRAGAGATRHRAIRLFPGGLDDLERTDTALRPGAGSKVRLEPDPRPVGRETPVGRKRHKAVAIGTGDGASPEVAVWPGVVSRFIGKYVSEALTDFHC